jgi:chromosomal replication initiator protein
MEHTEIWTKTKEKIKASLPSHAYNTWFDPISSIALNNEELVLEVPNQFFFEWIQSHYSKIIKTTINEELEKTITVKYTLAPEKNIETAVKFKEHEKDLVINRNESREEKPNLNRNFTFGSFIEGANNQFAKAAALSVSESPGKQTFNPLIIYGGVGLGKTHLLQAIGNNIIQNRPNLNIVCASSEKFTLDFISSIQKHKTIEFSKFYRKADVLLIDDIQFFQKKEQTQEQFFHTFNELYQSGKQIVLTADRYPGDMQGLQDRLLSRFRSGLSVDIQPPDLETRVAILLDKAEQNGLELPYDMIEFMAIHIKRNVRDLESTIIRLLAHSSLTNREIDENLIREVVKERVGESMFSDITIEDVVKRVSEMTSVSERDIVGKSRKKQIAEARQIAAYLCKEIIGASLSTIGFYFGGRDHTTILHSCRKVEKLVEENQRIHNQVETIQKELGSMLFS